MIFAWKLHQTSLIVHINGGCKKIINLCVGGFAQPPTRQVLDFCLQITKLSKIQIICMLPLLREGVGQCVKKSLEKDSTTQQQKYPMYIVKLYSVVFRTVLVCKNSTLFDVEKLWDV